MHMRTFTAKDMQSAIQMARAEMGDDVVLLSSDKKGDEIVVTFAFDREEEPIFDDTPAYAAAGNPSLPPRAAIPTPRLSASYEDILRYHATPDHVASPLLELALAQGLHSGETFTDTTRTLSKLLAATYRFNPLPLSEPGFRIMLVGPPGAGKTITAAKLAAKLVVDHADIKLITTDSKRAAASEQLQAFAGILGHPLGVAGSRQELETMLAACHPDTQVIIDSASCNPYDFQELRELGEFATIKGVEPVLVCPAGIEAGEAEEIAGVFSFLPIERVLISRTDCARRFGSLLTLAHAGGYAFCHTTSSARAMGDLQPMSPMLLATLLTQYQRDRMAA